VYILAKQLIDEGVFGDISLFRMRNGHDGASRGWLPAYWFDKKLTGGGALMDLGCHPCYLADWMLGAPKKMTASMTYVTGRETDDAAVCMVEFKNGAVAVLETSLITPYSPGILEIYGTRGSLRSVGDDVQVRLSDSPGWFKPERLPKAPALPMAQWVKAIVEDTQVEFDVEAGIRLTALLEAAYKSDETGEPVIF
jgi:predicted dehydrogenase